MTKVKKTKMELTQIRLIDGQGGTMKELKTIFANATKKYSNTLHKLQIAIDKDFGPIKGAILRDKTLFKKVEAFLDEQDRSDFEAQLLTRFFLFSLYD